MSTLQIILNRSIKSNNNHDIKKWNLLQMFCGEHKRLCIVLFRFNKKDLEICKNVFFSKEKMKHIKIKLYHISVTESVSDV